MIPKIFAVRIGEKYGQDVEDYINSKLPNVTWIRDETTGMKLQWNKLRVMNMNIDEPVLVIDIDMLLINDYMKAIEYPIERGEFLSFRSWWKDTYVKGYSLNGGFQKYYPTDCKFIYDKFMSRPEYWSEYYIKNEITIGPVNGEQFFVEDSLKERKIKLKFIPDEWVTRMSSNYDIKELADLNSKYSLDYCYLGNEFNESIKIVHFMLSDFNNDVIQRFQNQ